MGRNRVFTAMLSLAAGLLWVLPAAARENTAKRAGTSGAPFLRIAQGARAIGMGEAFAAVADDVSASYWNPAGLSQLRYWQATAMYNRSFEDINSGFVAGAVPVSGIGTVGGHVVYLNPGSTPVTDVNGDELGKNTSASDVAVAGSWARRVGPARVGANLKLVIRSLGDGTTTYTASAVAADLGGMYRLPEIPLTLALVVQHLGTDLTFIEAKETMPINLKVGAAYEVYKKGDHDGKLAVDLNVPRDNKAQVNLGGEYWYRHLVAGRVGWKGIGGVEHRALGGATGLTVGGGVRYTDLQLDYAFVTQGALGGTHKVSFTYNFGQGAAEQEKEALRRQAEEKARLAAEELKRSLELRK